jgi:hypothetical protein
LEETADVRHPAAFQSAIHAWLKTVNAGQSQYTATLYKYDPVHKQRQSCVCETIDEVLSLDDIGLTFGSGSYRYLVTFPDNPEIPPKAAVFNIHEVYDEKRKRLGLCKPDKSDADQGNGKSAMADSLELLTKLAEIMKSMFPAPAAPSPDIAAMIRGNYEFMQGILKKSYEDTSDMYKTMMQANVATIGEGEDKEDIQEVSLVEKFMPLLDKFLPLLIGEGPKAQVTVEMVKRLPEFQKLLADNQQLKSVIGAIKKEFGKEKTEKLLSRLGVANK